MKNTIKLTALLLLSGFSLFADTPVKTATVPQKDFINLHALPASFGVGISIQSENRGKASIEITDQKNHLLLAERFSKKTIQKAYNLAELALGDYTFTIRSNNDTITKRVHIYEEYGEKTWFIFQ